MLNLCGIVVAILKMATGRNFSMSGINSGHHNQPTYEMALKSDNVESVRYCGGHLKWRPVEICQCRDIIIYPHIKFWWYRTMLNFCGIVAAILKMETGRHFSMSEINSEHWNRTMMNLCGIVVAILKMATGRDFSMSRINSGHHNLPTY